MPVLPEFSVGGLDLRRLFQYPKHVVAYRPLTGCRSCTNPMARIKSIPVFVLTGCICVVAVAAPAADITPKPDQVPTQTPSPQPSAPTLQKPHDQLGESKPPAKAPSAVLDGSGKEQVSPSIPAPAKPATKGGPPPNGGAQTKPAPLHQLPMEIVGKDGAPMVLIPAGEFTMGSDKGDDDEQPIHKVFVDGFYIDKFEVTNGRFAKFVKAVLIEPPWGFADKDTPVREADYPVRWVNWMEAMGYCLWAGKRLPTEAEWEKAARGTDARMYPWGNDPPTSAHAVFGLKEGSDTVSPIGNREKGKSPYGVHDMAGNLYEWTMDWYDEGFYGEVPAINPHGPTYGTAKAQRGGSYTNSSYRLRSTFRTKGDPAEQEHNVGFRCAQDLPKQP